MRELILLFSETIGSIAVILLASTTPAIRNRPRLQFKYPKREGLLALGAGVILILLTVILTTFSPGFIRKLIFFQPVQFSPGVSESLLPPSMVDELSAAVFLLAVTAGALILRDQPLLSIGLRKGYLRAPLQIGLALAILALFIRGEVITLVNRFDRSMLLDLLAAFLSAGTLEVFYRGLIQPRLAAWLGGWPGIIATSFLFTICAITPVFLLKTLVGIALLEFVAYRFLFGILAGWIMQRSGSLLGVVPYAVIHLWLFRI